MNSNSDFVIENGILTKYTGKGADVIIPDGISGIGEKAFHKCAKMVRVAIPKSVKSIGVSAFQGCKKLESIVLPNGVTVLENNTFWGCSALKSVTLPNKLEEIRKGAFRSCSALEEIQLPDSLRIIGWCAFEHCGALKKLTIPAKVTHMHSGALQNCSLEELTLVGNTTIHANQNGWFSVEVIYGPNLKLFNLEEPAKKHAAVLGLVRMREKGQPLGDGVWDDVLAYIRRQRKALYPLALAHGEVLRLITTEKVIPQEDCLTLIDQAADLETRAWLMEYQHQNFQPVNPAKEMEKEFKAMERQIKQLEKFQETGILPAKLAKNLWKYDVDYSTDTLRLKEYVGREAHIVVPKGIGTRMVTAIQAKTFLGCTDLESLMIFEGIQTIEGTLGFAGGMFEDCHKLSRVRIPASLTSIYPQAFSGCTALTEWEISPENPVFRSRGGMLLEKDKLFAYPAASGKVVIPDSITEIGPYAFAKSALTKIHIPDSVTKIGADAFVFCPLTEIYLPDSITEIESGAFRESALTQIRIPNGVKVIGRSAFSSCQSLTHVTVPAGVESIRETAFCSCRNLVSMTLPETLTKINRAVFLNCPNLTVHAPAESYAERYAKENGIKFEIL